MTWGMQMEYDYTNPINIEKVKEDLNAKKEVFLDNNKQVINSISAYTITWEKTIAVVVWFNNNSDEIKLNELKQTFKKQVFEVIKTQDPTVIESKYINIGKSFGDYIKNTAFITLGLAIVAISLYVAFAFSWIAAWISTISFAIITIITLFNDVIVATWAYIFTSIFFPEYQIDTFFITALLTILGYSINDTIVVFDRIRSNLEKYAWRPWKNWKELYEIVNMSINATIRRSIYVSMALVFVLITIFLFWPDTISWFILAMLYGTVFGTFSSIFLASPILYEVNKNRKLSVYKKIVINPEDKIVV